MTDDSTEEDTLTPSEAVGEWVADEWEERYERPRGMLTDTDRKFLWGNVEYKHQNTGINRRKDIRGRVENGVLDLFYLTMLEDRDRERIFEELEANTDPGELRSAIAGLVHFLYLGLDGDLEWFEETLVHGIGNAEYTLGKEGTRYGQAEVNADITVSHGYNVDEIESRYQAGRGNTLTPAEIGVLVRAGRLDPGDFEKLRTDGPDPDNPVFDGLTSADEQSEE